MVANPAIAKGHKKSRKVALLLKYRSEVIATMAAHISGCDLVA
jgi:hypothetical protein